MIPTLLASGIILYGLIQLGTAFTAVVLALRWNKPEFLPGLLFLFIYTVIEAVDIIFFTIARSTVIDVAQFGFILIAILCFIAGMHPRWSRYLIWQNNRQGNGNPVSRDRELFSLLRKL